MATNGRNGNGHNGTRRRARKALRARAGRRGMPRWLSALLALALLGFVGVMAVFAIGFFYYQKYANNLVAPDELAINQPSYGAKIFDRNGKLLYEYVDDRSGLRRPVKLEDVAPAFLAATISTEDSTFFTNPGINLKGLGRAVWENVSPLSDTPGVFTGSGGSSITQQLVKNVYIPEKDRQKRDPDRKVKEVIYALELTQRYSKERILDWYINQISYGGVYNGVEAAAEGYFGKPAKDLTLGEAALLAGIPQCPACYAPINHPDAAVARRAEILDILEQRGKQQVGENKFFDVDPAAFAAAKNEP